MRSFLCSARAAAPHALAAPYRRAARHAPCAPAAATPMGRSACALKAMCVLTSAAHVCCLLRCCFAQPYSGSPANFAVYTALLQPHDRIMVRRCARGARRTPSTVSNPRADASSLRAATGPGPAVRRPPDARLLHRCVAAAAPCAAQSQSHCCCATCADVVVPPYLFTQLAARRLAPRPSTSSRCRTSWTPPPG